MSPAEREQRYRRAREVLAGAGWLFDEFVNAEMGAILKTEPFHPDAHAEREGHYHRARVASEMKLGLLAIVQNHEAEAKIDERRNADR